jgi:hypothetical protein
MKAASAWLSERRKQLSASIASGGGGGGDGDLPEVHAAGTVVRYFNIYILVYIQVYIHLFICFILHFRSR